MHFLHNTNLTMHKIHYLCNSSIDIIKNYLQPV
uniref:Uncharacterized protein n=1 Tax=Acinetobacter phage P919 TaxID=3229763 RepID=A0AB39AIN3_9CAUD